MNTLAVPLATLDPVVERVVARLRAGHNTALVAAPGSGATTLCSRIRSELDALPMQVFHFDVESPKTATDSISRLNSTPVPQTESEHPVLIIDHAASMTADDFSALVQCVCRNAERVSATCLWVGALDARAIQQNCGRLIYSVPRAHISFPVLTRDELLAVYRSIAEVNKCVWGEAILFMLLDFCGNDLSLIHDITEYLHGDWSDRLYDASIWDRANQWLANSPEVSSYRQRLSKLSGDCQQYLSLVRLGGKPPCPRVELLEEVDPALRRLCLEGFLVQNLLPGFYQLRNLTVRLLVTELSKPWDGYGPEFLFRRAMNERANQLLQDVETMLRTVMSSLFQRLGASETRELLKAKQDDGEFISNDLNRAILDWAGNQGGPDLRDSINHLLVERRKAFRVNNSIWARVTAMMAEEDESGGRSSPVPEHLRCVDYLTFKKLGEILLDVLDSIFPDVPPDTEVMKSLRERWKENISKVRRLRNQAAHLRNISFQDTEDLSGTVEVMRRDLIEHGGWR